MDKLRTISNSIILFYLVLNIISIIDAKLSQNVDNRETFFQTLSSPYLTMPNEEQNGFLNVYFYDFISAHVDAGFCSK